MDTAGCTALHTSDIKSLNSTHYRKAKNSDLAQNSGGNSCSLMSCLNIQIWLPVQAKKLLFYTDVSAVPTKCKVRMLKQFPALPFLGPWHRIKNTPLVLLTLFRFPASKRPIPVVDQWTHCYWMPLALQVSTTLQMDCNSALSTLKRTGY